MCVRHVRFAMDVFIFLSQKVDFVDLSRRIDLIRSGSSVFGNRELNSPTLSPECSVLLFRKGYGNRIIIIFFSHPVFVISRAVYYIKEIGCRKFFAPPATRSESFAYTHFDCYLGASSLGCENRVKFLKTLYGRRHEILKFFECRIAAADIVERTRFQNGENHLLRNQRLINSSSYRQRSEPVEQLKFNHKIQYGERR